MLPDYIKGKLILKEGISMLKVSAFFNSKIGILKNIYSLNKQNFNSKAFFYDMGIISDDSIYKKHFKNTTAPKIYKKHMSSNFISCVFCSHLCRSYCHDCCFTCSRMAYTDCSSLLPGVFTFYDKYFNSYKDDFLPWIYRTPCINFERLDEDKYFKNFISPSQNITITNFEVLEGIFLGISNGKKPCHICASVDIETYNRCVESENTAENKPCNKVIKEITAKYQAAAIKIEHAG